MQVQNYVIVSLNSNTNNIIISADVLKVDNERIYTISINELYERKQWISNMYDIEENNGEKLGLVMKTVEYGDIIVKEPNNIVVCNEKECKIEIIQYNLYNKRITKPIMYDINNCINNRDIIKIEKYNSKTDYEELDKMYKKYRLIEDGSIKIDKVGTEYIMSKFDRSLEELGNIVIPDFITVLSAELFRHITTNQTITLGKNVREIGEDCFSIGKVKQVIMNEKVEIIKDYAFRYSGITEITIPRNVKELGTNVFIRSDIKKVRIESYNLTLQEVHNAFVNCERLEKIEIPHILKEAFNDVLNNNAFCEIEYID